MQADDDFGSVAWDRGTTTTTTTATTDAATSSQQPDGHSTAPSSSSYHGPDSVIAQSTQHVQHVASSTSSHVVHSCCVSEGKVELKDTKEAFVSYLVSAKTELPSFTSKNPSARRRYTDFIFMRDLLTKDYPAAIVPPLPDKHRMERLSRHPKLSQTDTFRAFLESTEWNVFKHKQLARHSTDAEPIGGLLDSVSDTLLNAFVKVKKPDERFIEMRHQIEQFEEGLVSIERLGARNRTRLNDLTGDYEDLAMSVQGLGYLESGMTDVLMRFERALVDFGTSVREYGEKSSEPFLEHVHSLLAYSNSFKGVLKLRDQKQLDFEELSQYLSNVVSERDRLAGGFGYGMGIGSYLKDKVDSLRGAADDTTREAKLAKLDTKVKAVSCSLQEAVLNSQDTSQAFNEEVICEAAIFRSIKRAEMKELLGAFADGQIAMCKACSFTSQP
ncbi:BQ2448_113 [Microbotryum intermedium]|uniref:Sorting nexin-4 n=1 Tax=Microbotryum intermedium TaxID=269621 RepID=A0A238F1J4_9BASI|nr:BQ2448_113 [Microbotryum intermedium]